MTFEPIAIVGRGCVLPDAPTPAALWDNLLASRLSIATVPADRWGVRPGPDYIASDAGGYVRDFTFDAGGFAVPVTTTDPLCQWVLHAARQALREADEHGPLPRGGLVMGNLSFPSAALARFAEHVWQGKEPIGPEGRFSSGLPALLAAKALGLGAGAFALDAACASSLYAIKLACDRLHDRTADVMVAGAVNCPDDLFIHVGFTALSALSRTGRSRPFHREADGLVPAEGAAFVTLMRLPEAVAAGRRVLGVIRGIGLSNDGRSGGFLAPAQSGQERAMQLAYQSAGVAPDTVSLVECHATGTQVGDAVEAAGMARVFAESRDLPIGSVKSNLGHLITAAGATGLLKVLAAMDAGIRPPTLGAGDPIDALVGTPMRLLHEPEEWTGDRRAAVSAFGFGGNNAHLIVDAWTGDDSAAVQPPVPAEPVAIVAVGARVGTGENTQAFVRTLFSGLEDPLPRSTVDVELDGLRFPPRDLEQTHAQQLLVLEAAREAVSGLDLPRERTAVLIGMGCDPEVARYGARWRLGKRGESAVAALTSAAVVGAMPNVVANRINAQLDLAGPSFTVSAEQASGVVALRIAARMLRAGEVDAAIVGAVDLSHEQVHRAALDGLGVIDEPGDAAVVLVLRRRSDTQQVIAVLEDGATGPAGLVVGEGGDLDPAELFGNAHAASGLVSVAAAALALHHRAIPRAGMAADPLLGDRTAEVRVSTMDSPDVGIRLRGERAAPWVDGPAPSLTVYSGPDRAGVLAALAAGRTSDGGPARLVLVSADDELREAARRWLTGGGTQPGGVAFREQPLTGEVGFVFTNGSASYSGMGRELMLAFPEQIATLERRSGPLDDVIGWAYTGQEPERLSGLDEIWGSAAVGQLHVEITRRLLGIEPAAVLGLSSGETAALAAMGVWTDLAGVVSDARESGIFTSELAGDLTAVREAWKRAGVQGEKWQMYRVGVPIDEVRAALDGEPAVHLITINAPGLNVIGGEAVACLRVLRRLRSIDSIPSRGAIAVHAPELAGVRDRLWRLNYRPTTPQPGIRFYGGANGTPYELTDTTVADALTDQTLNTVDFVGMVERAYADGVRIFIEHGPRGQCTDWVQRILGDREHLAVALDEPFGRALRRLTLSVAELVAAGVRFDTTALTDHLAAAVPARRDRGRLLMLPAHPPAVVLEAVEPPAEPSVEVMEAAPASPGASHAPMFVAERPPPRYSPLVSMLTEHRRGIAAVHEDFLTLHSEVHQQFLASQQRLTALLTAGGTPVTPEPQPAATKDGELPGPKFDRADLEWLAAENISALFGPLFAAQDHYPRQTRMPQPPMLLADRVTGIDAEPGELGVGTIWTETDVELDSWYLDGAGRMPAGIMVEAGQADLLLISWMGIDLLNRGERQYRLLGCDLTFYGSPPRPGDTLRYEIGIDGHGEHDGIRLFFFHYDCYLGDELRMTVRSGQAGFFTDADLATTGGILWEPPPSEPVNPRSFGREKVRAFAGGRPTDCFGPDWYRTASHVRTPRIADDRMLLLDEVTDFDPDRGYLRATLAVSPQDWFFDGHFKNDPCMPGTLMFEGCLQAMSFYLAARGLTVDRDGWRFEPVAGQTAAMRCRGQVTPDSCEVIYEVFVTELSEDAEPVLIADVLCTVDGVKAFHASGVGLRLVPDWPLSHWRELTAHAEQTTGEQVPARALAGLVGYRAPGPVAVVDGFAFDYDSLLASAWGKPSEAFGPSYAVFDGTRKVARLPGPPFHFMSRIVQVSGAQGAMKTPSTVTVEYDVPDQVWYFEQNGSPTMPFCVLMEVVLQPCGWLAFYAGSAMGTETDLLFRNLDGTGTVLGEIRPGMKLRTHIELREISRSAGMLIESFTISCLADDEPVFEATAVFGCFPEEVFDNQVGLASTEEDRARLALSCDRTVDLTTRPPHYCEGELRLPGTMLTMLDRVTGYWPDGGPAGLGRLRSEKDVDPADWFFRAHFFQDPVQPGSLGIEAMCQLLQIYMIDRDMGRGISRPRFELEKDVTWKYRGQVVPGNRLITVELDVLEAAEDERGPYAVAEAWLWADDTRIYHAKRLGMRVLPGSSSSREARDDQHD
ncbi:beta keto-acyl synthase [Kribbella antibiotica]|uniref:Beta keto-acyl synthase n=1 Tax=Kribbella antibiotica TaxID=190195 RepID=A0A4R4ZSB6_9ACTN|nr:beta-ketoacyl synthase N-terminal-like domain-containing protein [Kribbella antibiotica]TDD61685.1 beta keto-acyl synthase [Kribbella antibiotica]